MDGSFPPFANAGSGEKMTLFGAKVQGVGEDGTSELCGYKEAKNPENGN